MPKKYLKKNVENCCIESKEMFRFVSTTTQNTNTMATFNRKSIYNRGTEINKVYFYDVEDLFENLSIDSNQVYNLLADENEFIYISNGFCNALKNSSEDIQNGEWHHYFTKEEDGSFQANKFYFN